MTKNYALGIEKDGRGTVTILTGKFEGVKFSLSNVKLEVNENSDMTATFDYDILEGTVLDDDVKELEQEIGKLFNEVLKDALEEEIDNMEKENTNDTNENNTEQSPNE